MMMSLSNLPSPDESTETTTEKSVSVLSEPDDPPVKKSKLCKHTRQSGVFLFKIAVKLIFVFKLRGEGDIVMVV